MNPQLETIFIIYLRYNINHISNETLLMTQISYPFNRLHYFSRSITMNRALNVCINFLGITILNTTNVSNKGNMETSLLQFFQKNEFTEDNLPKYQLVEGWSISKIIFAKLNDKGMISLSILALDRCKYFSTCIEIKRTSTSLAFMSFIVYTCAAFVGDTRLITQVCEG